MDILWRWNGNMDFLEYSEIRPTNNGDTVWCLKKILWKSSPMQFDDLPTKNGDIS